MIDKAGLASDLLSIKAVRLQPHDPFVYASGIRGPIYCDNRLIISYPLIRRRFTKALKQLSENLSFQLIAATATAAIPHGAWLADALDMPLIYVRGESKGHGAGKRVEGAFKAEQKVLLVEDLVTTGMSSLSAVNALRSEDLRVEQVISLFQYGLPEVNAQFVRQGVTLNSVLTLSELLYEGKLSGYLTEAEVNAVKQWQIDPLKWHKSLNQDPIG